MLALGRKVEIAKNELCVCLEFTVQYSDHSMSERAGNYALSHGCKFAESYGY